MADVFRDRLLQGKVAFITGGGSGINLRIAEHFAAQGAQVGLMGRKQNKLDRAAGGIRAAGGAALGIAGDVRNYEECENALRKTREKFDAIDILVCGAAGNFPATVLGMSANGFKAVIDIDLLGTFNTCRAAYEHLRKPGASVGVRVNVIAPGPVDDTEGMRRLAPTEEARRNAMASVPLGRFASKDEIAGLALFLCSDAAAYITGAICVCDGGQSLLGSRNFLAPAGVTL
jgi:NAD(P)-dependent dehydrogenase (short-subunit alcohol dehydrogenase family)